MAELKYRDPKIDIVKAIGILFMVAGHCGCPFTHFIYLFHMAIFIIASGYCYKENTTESCKSFIDFIKRKFMNLWFPFVFWTTIYAMFHNFFIRINVYTDNPLIFKYISGNYIFTTEKWSLMDIGLTIFKGFFLHNRNQLGGALWFISTLMVLSIFYCIIDFSLNILLKKNHIKVFLVQWIISVIFLILGFIFFKLCYTFAGMNKVFSFYILFQGGFTLKKYSWLNKNNDSLIHVLILGLMFSSLIICNKFGSIDLSSNSYVDPIYFFIVSFSGWFFLYEMTFFLKKINLLQEILICIGQNTLAVVLLQFLCFKIINYIGVIVNHQPKCLVAAFPVLYYGGEWWIAYTFVGIFFPVSLSLIWKEFKVYIKHINKLKK